MLRLPRANHCEDGPFCHLTPDRSLTAAVSRLSAEKVHQSAMKRPLSIWSAATLAGFAALMIAAPALADDDDDAREQEIARQALLDGRIKSLSEITEIVKPQLPGTVLGIKLEVEDDGSIIYEFDVVDPSGRLKEVDVDAATGNILKIEDDD
jgi:uncharacterized membrane protein YkoI